MSLLCELPSGYHLDFDPDVLTLVGPNSKVVGRFMRGTNLGEISLAAYQHAYEVQCTLAELQRLLGMARALSTTKPRRTHDPRQR